MSNQNNQLEEALAHQEQKIEELNDVVTKQWQEIDKLKQQLTRLGTKIDEVEEIAKEGTGESLTVSEEAALNKPPHY
ncbi:MAG: SlyX family protein [Pseudomonadota bacterium]